MISISDRIVLLDHLSPWIKGKRCVEIGVLHGDYSAEILKRGPAELHLVDPWQHQPDTTYNDMNNHEQEKFDAICEKVLKRFEANVPPPTSASHIVNGYWPMSSPLPSKSIFVHRQFSHQFLRKHTGLKFDFAFIDGNHSYAGVMADLFMLYPLMNPGGWICGHDYGEPSHFIGVQQAVISFCKITGLELGIVTEDPWASFGIQVKE